MLAVSPGRCGSLPGPGRDAQEQVRARNGGGSGRQLDDRAGRHREPLTIPACLDCAEHGDSEHSVSVEHRARYQRAVSAEAHRDGVPDENALLLHRLIGEQPGAAAEVLVRAADSTSAPLLVAAALLAGDPAVLSVAAQYATTTRDRQLVAVAEAHLHGNADLRDVLVRDHLSEHPDNLLASWIAGRAIPRP